jgi:hypothetical protein
VLRDCLVEYYDYRRSIDAAAHRDALLCFESVSQREPRIARVWSAAAMLHLDEYGFRYGRDPSESLEAARSATAEALAIDRDDPQATLALARLQYFEGDPAFRDSIERALSLRPDSAEILAHGGVLLVLSGDSPAGLPWLERAKQGSKSLVGTYYFGQAVADLRAGRLDAALTAAQQIDAPNWVVAHLMVAAAAGLSGKDEVARAAARRVLELDPEFETEVLGDIERWRFDREYADQLLTGLRAAGLEIADRQR